MNRTSRGQALVELAVVLPVLLGVALGGMALARLAVQQADVRLAAWVGASSQVPVTAAKTHLQMNGMVDAGQAGVRVNTTGYLRKVTVTCPAVPGWWPWGATQGSAGAQLSASAVRAKALLCIR